MINYRREGFQLVYATLIGIALSLTASVADQSAGGGQLLKDLEAGEFETFFHGGSGKPEKASTGRTTGSGSDKSKVDVLGEVLKRRVAMLRASTNKQVDLVFLVDSSASVGAENFYNELKFVKKLLADFTVSVQRTRVAVVTFSSRKRVIVNFDHLTNVNTSNHKCRLLEEQLPAISYSGGGTYTLGAVIEAQNILRSARPSAAKAVFLVTDGYSNGGDPRPATKRLRDAGVEVFTFGIKNGNVRELWDMASPPQQEHSYILDSFEEFEALARRALHEDLHIGSYQPEEGAMCSRLCEEKEDCCDADANCTCGIHSGHYACTCRDGFYGTGLKGDCTPCPSGTYLEANGPAAISACKPCPDSNHYSDPGSSSSSECVCRKGYRSNNDSKCVVIECPKLEPPPNGYFVKNVCSSVFNGACGIRCNPGYRLAGSSIRLCSEDGVWTGEQPTCIIKSCQVAKQPRHGHMECSNPEPLFETHCNFSCEEGYALVGSKMRTCLAIASWDGLPSHCRPVTCSPLAEILHGTMKPSKCATHKSQYADLCEVICDDGFTLEGPTTRQCQGQGVWNFADRKQRCLDTSPPNMTCPDDMTVLTDDKEKTATVNWTHPEVNDNGDDEPSVLTIPAVHLPMKFPIGTSSITYVAQDRSQNRIECTFNITVVDNQPPTVDRCVSPPTFLSHNKSIEVDWEEPIFSDNSGVNVSVERSHSPPAAFPYGDTIVTYTAWDDAGNNSTCAITVTVQPNACSVPMDPIHGHANCSEIGSGVLCSLTCQEGYAFAFRPKSTYFCAHDGVWTPSNGLPFPECSVTALPSDVLQNGVVTLQSDDIPCEDIFFLHQVENKFQRKISNKVQDYCANDVDCDVTYVSAACEQFMSENEEESNYILRRRRRQATTQKTQIAKSDNPTLRLDNQRVALKFQVIGSSKAVKENVSVGTLDLGESILEAMQRLKVAAEMGELDLHMGQRHLTYSGMKLISGPNFVCEPGSILQDDRCVKCPVGTFYNVISETCQACDKGSYQFVEGQLSCLVCPGNTSTSHGNSKSPGECKAQCLPGTFSLDGLEVCETCPKGFYQQGYSSLTCLLCPGSTTTWRRGSRRESECKELCPRGHVSETGLIPCYPCPSGYYQPEAGKRVCFRCRDASQTKQIGSTSEDDCLRIESVQQLSRELPVQELAVNECFSFPCLNGGSCRVLSFAYVCDCPAGFTGMHCEKEIDECQSSPCQNGGKCKDGLNTYTCQCSPGYEGSTCEADINECQSHPCHQNGTCVDQINNFMCKCPEGFQGKVCQTNINECATKPCQNGAKCVDLIASFRCECLPGFIGQECEIDVDECESNPCYNGATCKDLHGKFRCQCVVGFVGERCETNVDDCASQPCTNGAICEDHIDAFKCICPPAYSGTTCENELSSDFVMHFPMSGIMDYVQADGFRHDLTQASFCLWLKSNDKLNYGTPISYANASVDNIFTLTDYNGFVLYVNGEKVITDVTANDGQWHFICVSWSSSEGHWRIYKDGVQVDEGYNLANGTLIPAHGVLVAGQEQDSPSGGFSAAESFIGHIGWINFWDRVLGTREVLQLTSSCHKDRGSIRAWPDFLAGMKGRVKIEESLFCKGCRPTAPESFVDGKVTVSGSGVESMSTYECVPGFSLKGNARRKCLIHGDWEGESPICERTSCDFPGYLANGNIVGNRYLYQDVIKYVCNSGYRLIGNVSRVCQANGQWGGQPPQCAEVLCPPPIPPDYGEFASSRPYQFPASTKVEFRCRPGYRMHGSAVVTCTPDGHWDEEILECQPVPCSDPPRIANGRVLEDADVEVHVGQHVTFACDEGYTLIGDRQLLCAEGREWHGEMPHCVPVDCDTPPSVSNSTARFNDTIFGSSATYICHAGYLLGDDQVDSVRCEGLGKWVGRLPACYPVVCPQPQGIRFGEITVADTTLGSVVRYSCMEGYELSGPATRSCSVNATWSESAPKCSRVKCADLDPLHHGRVKGREPWVAGGVVTYSCDKGYIREGASQSTCLDGGAWSSPPPRCVPVACPAPNEIQNGYSSSDGSFVYGSVVTYRCNEGYQLSEGRIEHSRRCSENGSWNGSSPVCEKVSCGSVDSIKNGRVIFDSFLYQSRVGYSCDKGFKLEGAAGRTCLANGTWSDREPSCTLSRCPGPEAPRQGNVQITETTPGATAEYECQKGHVLDGPSRRKCEEDRKGQLRWSGDPPECVPIVCTTLEPVPNGLIRVPSFTYDSVAEYECASGYELTGATVRVCREDGSWSEASPECRVRECPSPSSINETSAGGVRMIGGSRTVGAFLQFECEPGHRLVGHRSVACGEDQRWNGSFPKCERVNCPWPPPKLESGVTVNVTGHSFGDSFGYACELGHRLVGAASRTCLANGEWSDTTSVCEPVSCDPPEEIAHGSIDIRGRHFGDSTHYSCEEGFMLSGTAIRRCQADRIWSGSPPACEAMNCTELAAVDNGWYALSDESLALGTTANYSCNVGFKMIGTSDGVTCVTPGYWLGEVPICQRIECTLTADHRDLSNGVVVYKESYQHPPVTFHLDSVLEFRCQTGFKLVGEQRVACEENGSWSAPFPVCAVTSCSLPPPLPNGKMSAEEFTVGAKVIYSCNVGYRLVGAANRTCDANNTWSGGNFPRCHVVECPDVPRLTNGDVVSGDGKHVYGTNVSFECHAGYFLNGSRMLQCDRDGRWDGEFPFCQTVVCPKPMPIPHGKLQVLLEERTADPGLSTEETDQYSWGSQIWHQCEEGYMSDTNLEPRMCNSVGEWTSSEPRCRAVSCGPLADPPRGRVRYDSTDYGSVSVYACNSGFRLQVESGSERRTCMMNGQWSGVEPACLEIRCTDVGQLRHGTYRLRGNGTLGATVTAECDVEYRLEGAALRTCAEDGEWSGGTEPFCASIECAIPEVVPHGRMEIESTQAGGTVLYSCEHGYELVGDPILTCMVDGGWSHRPPACSLIECPALQPDTPHGQITLDDAGRRVGAVATYICRRGYELVGGKEERTCMENRTWSGREPACVPTSCDPPPHFPNGLVLVEGSGGDSVARYSCSHGYRLLGDTTRTCDAEAARWSGAVPSCRAVTCPSKAIKVTNGRVVTAHEEPYEYGAVVTVVCSPLHSVRDGASKIRCTERGEWDSEMPVCVRSHCDRPSAVLNAVATGNHNRIGSKISYACREGYHDQNPLATADLLCSDDGSWVGMVPNCQPLSCPPPVVVDHAVQQLVIPEGQPAHSFGSTVVYACADGHELFGSSALVCEAEGRWVGTVPQCRPQTCAAPPAVVRATVQVENFEHLSRAIYSCEKGYTLVGQHVAHCLPSGSWDAGDESPKCVPVTCGFPPSISNGRVTTDHHRYGAVPTYSCNRGYRLKGGSNSQVCSSKGYWKGRLPRCHPVTCPPPELPANVLLDSGGEFLSGGFVNYTCRSGFRLVGDSSRRCLENGSWTGVVPQCFRIFCDEPVPPTHGYVMIDDMKFGDVARFACEDGYTLDGDTHSICNEHGNWTMASPTCNAVSCGVPMLPLHATLLNGSADDFKFGDTVEVSCVAGFLKTAPIKLNCRADGSWSQPVGRCKRIFCGPPQPSNGAFILGNTFAYQDRVSYMCPPGSLHRMPALLTCQADGKWDSQPICEVSCSKLCMNGGLCTGNDKCKCPVGYTGDRCQTPLCILPCLNGGTCVGSYMCLCKVGFRGSRCQSPICLKPCLHGGTCTGHNLCSCLPTYSGLLCQTPVCNPPCPAGRRCLSPNVCQQSANNLSNRYSGG